MLPHEDEDDANKLDVWLVLKPGIEFTLVDAVLEDAVEVLEALIILPTLEATLLVTSDPWELAVMNDDVTAILETEELDGVFVGTVLPAVLAITEVVEVFRELGGVTEVQVELERLFVLKLVVFVAEVGIEGLDDGVFNGLDVLEKFDEDVGMIGELTEIDEVGGEAADAVLDPLVEALVLIVLDDEVDSSVSESVSDVLAIADVVVATKPAVKVEVMEAIVLVAAGEILEGKRKTRKAGPSSVGKIVLILALVPVYMPATITE